MYWKEPFNFRPARFIDTPEERWDRDACSFSRFTFPIYPASDAFSLLRGSILRRVPRLPRTKVRPRYAFPHRRPHPTNEPPDPSCPTVESVAIISHICRNYTIHLRPSRVEECALRPGESERARLDRVFLPTNGITLTPQPLPLIFRRRVPI